VVFLAMVCLDSVSGEEEKAPKVSKVNVGISVMLLGSIGFMMALFELTHCYRKTMAMYSWKAISATISIFSAVLIFQGVNGLVEAYILEGASESTELVVVFAHMLAWFIALQFLLAIITGVMPIKGFNPRFDNLEVMEARLKTFAILLGHITGFAAIHAFAVLQNQVADTALEALAFAFLPWVVIFVAGRLTDSVRERIALIGDNKKEKHEAMWDDETEETEDDVVGLAVSFCFVQGVRFAIGGHLPNDEGDEPNAIEANHTTWEAGLLVFVGVVLAAIEILRVIYIQHAIPRLTCQLKNIIAMTFAWCLFYGTDWCLAARLFGEQQGMTKQVSQALCVTIFAMMMIFCLEVIQDFKHVDHTIDEAIRAVINAIGILIGVAWEKAFDVAVAEATETVDLLPAQWSKLLLSVCLAGMVVPAWYRHIMPNILLIEAEEEGKALDVTEDLQEAHAVEQGATRSLQEPLLQSGSGSEEAKLREACEYYQKKIAELEKDVRRADELQQKNAVLEESMAGISSQLAELQSVADKLIN